MTILGTTTAEVDARLINLIGQPQDAGFKLVRGWPWLAGNDSTPATKTVKELFEDLNVVTSYTNPKANGKTYTGKFILSENRAFDENQDGTAARDCQIVQTITKVKTVTDVASLGTPDKNADRQTLNFLGFKEGEQFHIYHKYRNLDPADRATAMGLSPTETNYTIVKREFITEADKTGTLLVVFEDDDWLKGNVDGAVWGGNDTDKSKDTLGRVRVSYENYDENRNLTGHGFGEAFMLTGLAKTNLDTNWVAAQKSDTKSRVITNIRRSERANGEYVINQTQRIAFQGAKGSDALVTRIKDPLGGSAAKGIVRTWFRRTDTAKNALIAAGGKARSGDTVLSATYYHSHTDITDHGDGTYTVTQAMEGGDTALGAAQTFFSDSYAEVKIFTRSTDNHIKKVYYWKFVAAKATLKSCYDYIEGKALASVSGGIVPGSDHVVKKAPFYYEVTCKRPQRKSLGVNRPRIDDWAANPQV